MLGAVTTSRARGSDAGDGPTHKRLAPDARRAQLVRLGLQQIRSRPFDQVLIDDVTEAAGISKGLLFHYFPSKRDFLAAVIRAAAAELLAATQVDPEQPQADRLRAGLRAYIAYIEQQPSSYIAIARGAGSDEQLLEIFEDTRSTIVERITAQLDADPSPVLRLATRGWVAMVEEATFKWLEDRPCGRDELIEMLEMAALLVLPRARTLGAAPDADASAG